MKIAEICPRYYPHIGEVEKVLKEISTRLTKDGYDVSVYNTDPQGQLPKSQIIRGVKIKRFRSITPHESYYFPLGLISFLTKIKADLFHLHGSAEKVRTFQ